MSIKKTMIVGKCGQSCNKKPTVNATNKKNHECGARLLNAGIPLILACDIIPDTLVIN